MQKFRRFMVNGFILSATSLLLRGIGVAFNAFVSQKLGADGMGLFTLIMSVYGLAVTVAASGVNLAATRMCAEELGKNDAVGVRAALRRCLLYAVFCGTFACVTLYLGSDLVAEDWLGDKRCAPSLRLLALSLPFIAASNVLHGYFNAIRRAVKSASCRIFEQLFKVSFCVWALLCAVPDGIEYACIALVGGGALAEFLSFTMALLLYLAERKGRSGNLGKEHGRRLTVELFSITVPVALAACIRSGLSTLEHMLIPRGLSKNPLTAPTAMATYGTLCGMVMPVIMFPTALLYSFTDLLIPEFSESVAVSDGQRLRSMTSRALGMTAVFSIGCAVFMWAFSAEIGEAVYRSREAGVFIGIMAPLIPVMYLDHAVDAILKGMGEQIYCMKINIADAAMCTALVYLLCPVIGIWGYIVTIYLAEAVNFALSLYRLSKLCRNQPISLKSSVGSALIAVTAVYGARLLTKLVGLNGAIGLTAGGAAAALFYCILLYLAARKPKSAVRSAQIRRG